MQVWPPLQSLFTQHAVVIVVEQWPGPRCSQFGGGQSIPPALMAGLPISRACVFVKPP
jgi:hypothetical protein